MGFAASGLVPAGETEVVGFSGASPYEKAFPPFYTPELRGGEFTVPAFLFLLTPDTSY
jgi:hypothetical protein